MEFKGCSVFLDCGSFGVYQGKVSEVDSKALTITLINVMKDGEFIKGKVTVNSAEINDIKVLKMAEVPPPRKSKTVAIKNKLAESAKKDVTTEKIIVPSTSKPKEETEPPKPKVQMNEEKPVAPWHVVKPTAGGDQKDIMQQLLVTPKPITNHVTTNDSAKINKQKPIEGLMIPTSAIRILKRGEALPSKSTVNGKENIPSQKKKVVSENVPPKNAENPVSNASNNMSKKASKKPKENNGNVKSASKGTTVDSVISQPSNSPDGIRMDPKSLISALTECSLSPAISPYKSGSDNPYPSLSPRRSVPERSLSVNDQPINKPQFEKFGDFKYFTEKQAPMICNLKPGSQRPRGNARSPSGNPTTDFSNGYGRVHKKNRDLDGPIDHDEFRNDFDFQSNLALFVREEDEDEDTSDEAPAHIRNYRNDENILEDPSRVTSWTAKLHEFQHSAVVSTPAGVKVPVLSIAEKKKFLNIVGKSLGEEVFTTLVADNLMALVLNIVKEQLLDVNNIVVLGSKDTKVTLINRLAMHFVNRKYHGIFVNCASRIPLPNIEFTDDMGIKKVNENIQIVIVLEGGMSPKLEMTWLNRVAYGKAHAHVISLEDELPQFSSSHSLYLETLVEAKSQNGKHQVHRSVADLGIPFSWFKEEASKALSEAFSKSTLISI